MSSWDLLDDKDEADLHKARLLNVENKPLRRLLDRLTIVASVVSSTIPLRGLDNPISPETTNPDFEQLRQDITLDFAAFDSTILRLQSLHDANIRERDRYKVDQDRILLESESARAKNALLRQQLDGARATLAQRKQFDAMAERITSNRLLKPRDDQLVNLAKLEEECRELERESETYSLTWRERRDQFNRIMEEGMMLRRQIRDEKEEVDRREGMNEGGEDGTPAPESRGGTPAPDTDKANNDGETPQPAASNAGTPSRDSPGLSHLRPAAGPLGSLPRIGSRGPSRSVTPMPREDGEDEEMEDTKDSKDLTEVGTPQIAVDPPENNGDKMEVDN